MARAGLGGCRVGSALLLVVIVPCGGHEHHYPTPPIPCCRLPLPTPQPPTHPHPTTHSPPPHHYPTTTRQAKLGFNNWSLEPLELDLKPTSLWQGPGVDWWASQVFQVPEEGAEVCIAFSDGGQRWDSNSGRDYRPAVRQVRELQLPQRRDVAKVEVRGAGGAAGAEAAEGLWVCMHAGLAPQALW